LDDGHQAVVDDSHEGVFDLLIDLGYARLLHRSDAVGFDEDLVCQRRRPQRNPSPKSVRLFQFK
jgi:hypothetical protein